MLDRLTTLAATAPHLRALTFHGLELVEARRRRLAGEVVEPELGSAEAHAALGELATSALLGRARAVCDGPLILIKGPEVALDWPAPRLRRYGDLDLICADPPAAQAAMLAAGFQEVGEEWRYQGIHHLRPLWWPGLPLTIELHERPKWPCGIAGPTVQELVDVAVPSRTGARGISALPPAEHTLLLAGHAWGHEPLARLGQLVDVAVTAARTSPGEIEALARRWGCAGLWRTTWTATRAAVLGEGHSSAVAVWARHLRAVRERTVLESHTCEFLAPLWARGGQVAPRALRRDAGESWTAKLSRTAVALAHAGVSKADHDGA